MIELRDVVLQLRFGESIKSVHRSTGRHKTGIRKLKALTEQHKWLNPVTSVPDKAAVQASWLNLLSPENQKQHPLDALHDDFKRWIAGEVSLVVMHRLASKRVPCSEPTLRRYVHRRFKV